ncbi:MAG: hypothetical protein AAF616_11605, partial [Bacteroidota bacterium]
MSEKEAVLERLKEKEKMRRAERHMTKLFIFSSSILFLSFVVAWLLLKLPEMIIPEIYDAASIIIIISSVLL